LDKIDIILEIIFDLVIALTMFLCFFSLSSSMTANILDQAKEIGILRSLGLSKTRITLMFLYESFLLVISASILGILIGFIIASTLVYQ
jgi:ABC-type antimicrobial peptide transport system permease subunit